MPITTQSSPATHKLAHSTRSPKDLTYLHEYNKKYLGEEHFNTHMLALGGSFLFSLSNQQPALIQWWETARSMTPTPAKSHGVHPSPIALCSTGFGKPDLLH